MGAKQLVLALAYNYKMPTQQNTGKQKDDLNPPVWRKLKGKEFKLSLKSIGTSTRISMCDHSLQIYRF